MSVNLRVVALLVVLGVAAAACGGATPTPTVVPIPTEIPPSVSAAWDAALAYVNKSYPDWAPGSGLAWTARNLTPVGLVGVAHFEFDSPPWIMAVNAATLSPSRLVYEVEIRNEEAYVHWSGKLNSSYAVLESNLNVVPEARTARDLVLGYVRRSEPDQAPPEPVVWLGERSTPMGSVGHEYCEFSAVDWKMQVEYAPDAPDRVTYLILLQNPTSNYVWRGQVDAEGTVLQFRQ